MVPNSNWNVGHEVYDLRRYKDSVKFAEDEAKEIMLSNNSRIRLIGMGPEVFTVCFCKMFLKANPSDARL